MEALESISLDDMNEVAKELCEHLSHIDAAGGVRPAAVIACAPMMDRNNQPFSVTDEEVAEAIGSALTEELEPLQVTNPCSLSRHTPSHHTLSTHPLHILAQYTIPIHPF